MGAGPRARVCWSVTTLTSTACLGARLVRLWELSLVVGITLGLRRLPAGLRESEQGMDNACICGPSLRHSYFPATGSILNFVRSSLISPFTYAVISVPFGIVVSFPCVKRKNGAAGHTTIAVAFLRRPDGNLVSIHETDVIYFNVQLPPRAFAFSPGLG